MFSSAFKTRLLVPIDMPPRLPFPRTFYARPSFSQYAPQRINAQIGRWRPQSTAAGSTRPAGEGITTKDQGDGAGASDLKVGEIDGVEFRVEPLRRVGEDARTMRARLLCPHLPRSLHPQSPPSNAKPADQSRKRGTLESDLLLSTFADARLPGMTVEQMREYDLFLDENDWDIYYWATQEEPAGGAGGAVDAPTAKEPEMKQSPRPGEWAQTVGTFKAAYRPVPSRWSDAEVLKLLRAHVEERRQVGMGFMPPLRDDAS
jgi:succinate dehydrogenase flavin-adding protein (antitoxin of CptAB toxin-antitoxin module)